MNAFKTSKMGSRPPMIDTNTDFMEPANENILLQLVPPKIDTNKVVMKPANENIQLQLVPQASSDDPRPFYWTSCSDDMCSIYVRSFGMLYASFLVV